MPALIYVTAHPGRVMALALVSCGTFDSAARDRREAAQEERTDDNLR